MSVFLFFLLAYSLGSIPFGMLIAKQVKGIDLRQHGSGNVGATNAFRVVGKKWGILVFVLDALKGAAAVGVPSAYFGDGESASFPLYLLFGITAILGHSFPLWLSFRGGKGVATSLGVFLALAPLPALITFAIWILAFLSTRIISLASLTGAFCFPFVVIWTCRNRAGFDWLLLISILLTFFMVYTHRTNIQRLLRGEEKKIF